MKITPNIRFTKLVTVHLDESVTGYNKKWFCKCDCGTVKSIWVKHLIAGRSKSCGCLRDELSIARALQGDTAVKTKHSMSYSKEYRTWSGMKARCLNEKSTSYNRYGKLGISVCDRWVDSFENFYADMGSAPSPKHSIERINYKLGYFPENCTWADSITQARNKKNNRHITISGQTKTLAEWAQVSGFKVATIWARLNKGLSAQEAITKPNRYQAPRISTSIV